MKGTVRVHVGGKGSGIRVSMFIYQTLASGMTNSVYTNNEGDAYIELDTDTYAEAEVYVDGQKKVSRGRIEETYYI